MAIDIHQQTFEALQHAFRHHPATAIARTGLIKCDRGWTNIF
jgi:hypothetical protein